MASTDKELPEVEQSLPPLEDGEMATVARVDIKKKETRPPAKYTEGTLLDDMKAAAKFVEDDPELKKVLRDVSGLGTAATRDSIIETLKHHEYIAKSGKHLVATPKGIAFIQWLEKVMPELVDVGITARWEAELGLVAEKGGGHAFEERVAANVRRMISIFRTAPTMGSFQSTDSKEPTRMSANAPSPKMLEFASNIAKKLAKELPDEVRTDWEACKKFIDENKDAANRPTDKQLNFAKKIAESKGLTIPDDVLADGRAMSKWIDENK